MAGFVVIIYFDGHASRWRRSAAPREFRECGSSVVVVEGELHGLVPKPDPSEVLQLRTFRYRWYAEAWAGTRIRGFEKLRAEVRPS
jgi:hypothetical protein